MARSKSKSRSIVRAPSRSVKPIVIRTTKVVKQKHRRHHGGGGLGLGGFLSGNRTQMAVAGAVVGYIDKQGWNMPKLPFLGEHGTIAVGAYFLSQGGKNQLAANVCTAAMVLAGYEFAKTGSIVGGDGDDFTGGL